MNSTVNLLEDTTVLAHGREHERGVRAVPRIAGSYQQGQVQIYRGAIGVVSVSCTVVVSFPVEASMR
jgi:hypothetical protein